jgi:DNA-binding winged helix-turn-helix (wHTH) protein
VQISRIRKKLREAGVTRMHLDTIQGRGYCLSVDVAPHANEASDDDANEDDCAAA